MKKTVTLTNAQRDLFVSALQLLESAVEKTRQAFLDEARATPFDIPKGHAIWRAIRNLQRARECLSEARCHAAGMGERLGDLPSPESISAATEEWLRRQQEGETK